jgi:hypothetical protein
MLDLDIDKPLEPQIRRSLVSFMLNKLHLDLDEERQERIADGMRDGVDNGVPVAYAFSTSLELELAMYGDPH